MKISILTPTYNREKLLERLYKSILKNLNYGLEVEWLIMDDGSTDGTAKLIEKFINENKFDIQYYSQENKGKMVAINNLLPYSTGELIIECDSDDYFKQNAFLTIKNTCNELDENTYAMCYLKYDQNECNIGNLFKEKETTMFDLYFKQGEKGEKALVYNANIRKQYNYELEKDEKFVTEARMYHKMDLKYKIKCINEPIMICEYQEGGYSKNIIEVFKKYPKGYYEYFKEMFDRDLRGIYLKKRLYILKHYILFSYLTKKSFKESINNVKGVFNKVLVTIMYVPGMIITKRKFL
ncbi:MAG: glycosyltransferase family 2 protein [Clostridia bacterium]|nr:glycosyltransferase family 2 protein [Clostridia bacterium]